MGMSLIVLPFRSLLPKACDDLSQECLLGESKTSSWAVASIVSRMPSSFDLFFRKHDQYI